MARSGRSMRKAATMPLDEDDEDDYLESFDQTPKFVVNPRDSEDMGGTPETVPRSCTDTLWLLIFILPLGALAFIVYSANVRGNLDEMRALSDWEGKVCGHGEKVGYPYLFFCQDSPGMLNFNPICIDQCPRSANGTHRCFVNSSKGVKGGFTGWKDLEDYPSFQFIGMYCKPFDERLVAKQKAWLDQNPPIAEVSSLRRAWHPLAVCIIFAVLNSYIYIFLLKHCANCLVWTGLAILTVVPLTTGTWFLYCWNKGGCGDEPDAASDLTVGGLLTGVGLLFACVACRLGHSIDLAISCITWSCKCVLETPSLKVGPLVTLALRTALFSGLAGVFSLLLSTGKVDPVTNGTVWDLDIRLMAAALLFLLFWLQQIITSMSSFAIIYVTELWYFHGGLHEDESEGVPLCSLTRAYFVMFRYHMGTIIFGALVIGLVQPVRLAVGALTSAARMEENPVGMILGTCCICLVDCYNTLLDFISRNAYMDVALNAKPWCEAAEHALQVIRDEASALQILNGATWLFQFAGLGAITCLGHLITLIILQTCPSYTSVSSPMYVPNPELSCVTGALLSFMVGFPFMMLFDIVSDTILYCNTVERQRKWKPTMMERACAGDLASFLGDIISCGNCAVRPLRPEEQQMMAGKVVDENPNNPFNPDVSPSYGNGGRSRFLPYLSRVPSATAPSPGSSPGPRYSVPGNGGGKGSRSRVYPEEDAS